MSDPWDDEASQRHNEYHDLVTAAVRAGLELPVSHPHWCWGGLECSCKREPDRSPGAVLLSLVEAGVSVRTTRVPMNKPDFVQHYQAGMAGYGFISWRKDIGPDPVIAALRAYLAAMEKHK